MALSSGLTLTDLSDYLAPSAICIKPVQLVPDTSAPSRRETQVDKAKTEIKFDAATGDTFELDHGIGGPSITVGGSGVDDRPAGSSSGTKLKKAEITLNDCLACSGCITSAESVLVSLQSHQEVYSVLSTLDESHLVPILSISPQSLASLAAAAPPDRPRSIPHVLRSLRRFFKTKLGFRLVFDTTFAREVSLMEGRKELVESLATSRRNDKDKGKGKGRTVLSSACPGWICYAEKTHGALLPLVSTTKSSQAVQGVLVKQTIVPQYLDIPPEKIYHVSVMPCYDKKLEASRPDFADDVLGRETDCVLTTGEVEAMLEQEQWDLDAPLDPPWDEAGGDEEESLFPSLLPLASHATTSGGYIHNAITSILDSVSPSLFPFLRLVTTSRGSDYDELTLSLCSPPNSAFLDDTTGTDLVSTAANSSIGGQQVLLRAARCYGFRNLQNVVRRVSKDNDIALTRVSAAGGRSRRPLPVASRRAGASEGEQWTGFDFVEIMACPSGCVNGGGQLKLVGGVKEGVRRVEDAFSGALRAEEVGGGSERYVDVDVDVDESVRGFLPPVRHGKDWERIVEVWTSGRAARGENVWRTQYRAVEEEQEVNGLAVKW